jgi:hypothetical protein
MRIDYNEDEIRAFILQLGSEDDDIANEAIDALIVSEPEIKIPLLIQALPENNDAGKQRICFLLGVCEEECCVPPLLDMLDDIDDFVAAAAIEALEQFARSSIITPLSEKLYSDNPHVVKKTIHCFGKMLSAGVVEAIEPLIHFIKIAGHRATKLLAVQNFKYLEEENLLQAIDELKKLQDADLQPEIPLLLDELEIRREDNAIKEIKRLFRGLSSQNYVYQKACESEILAYGKIAADIMLEIMFADGKDTQQFVKTVSVVKKMCWKALPSIRHLIETFNEFNDKHKMHILGALISCLPPVLYPELEPAMLGLLDRSVQSEQTPHADLQSQLRSLKTSVHVALAECGCTAAMTDLIAMFNDGINITTEELLKAIRLIGGQEFLRPLSDMHADPSYSWYVKKEAEKAFAAISKRTRLEGLPSLADFGRPETNN